MAASSSSLPWRYSVFTSFHGPDVRKTFLSHLRKQFSYHGSSMFDDQGMERSQTIAPAHIQAIKESRISIVVLSKNYASSSWCLDELVEILKCMEDIGQIVMTVFYGVDPSDVRKQTGDFGKIFEETCAHKTEEERRKWRQALNDVTNIAGEHFLNWDDESEMIEKIARDVSNKLNTTISWDFEDMVGIEAHLQKLQSLLHLDEEDGAMIVGICGPPGIGKTTIAKALYSRLSSSFQLKCFLENLRGNYNDGLDEYGFKLRQQEQLLSKILNQNDMRIHHLGAIKERLCDQKVLIILDDVDNLEQLETLANGTHWFGPGSRIIITTEDQKLLNGINDIYHVDFPSEENARKIFCRYAFRQSSAPYGFENLSKRVPKLCGKLPLSLRVMGSTLHGKKENEWENTLHRLENSLNQDIEGVLRVGFDNLHENDQLLFLYIAFFFNYKGIDHVKAMLASSNIDVRLGLKTLAFKSLIQISSEGSIVMHNLLQQVGREVVERSRSEEKLLIHVELCDVHENSSGSTSVTGKSLIPISTEGKQMDRGAVKRKGTKKQVRIHADELPYVHENNSASTSVTGKSLIHLLTGGKQVGREAVKRKRLEEQVLIHADEFPDVLENDTGSTSVTGKSLIQISTERKQVSRRAVKRPRLEEQVLIHADHDIRVVLENDSDSASVSDKSPIQILIEGKQLVREAVQRQEQSSSNKPIGKSKSWCFTRMGCIVVINLLLEIVSAVADQLSSTHKPYFAIISLVMSFLSVALSILDLYYKIQDHKACFRCKWPIPWFYYSSPGYNRIFGSFTDTVLLFCGIGQCIVSMINWLFMGKRQDGLIKVSVWPLFFAVGKVGSEFMEKPTNSEDNSCNKNVLTDIKTN